MRAFEAPDGRRLVFDDEGEGPAVLCLAGLTRDARDFAGLAEHLAPRYRVVRLDARGRGRSEVAADPMAEYQVPVEAGDALALLDHLGIARATVVGTSRGGLQAMVIAATAKERLAGVVLNDIGPVVEEAGLAAIAAYLGQPPVAASFEEAAAGLAAVLHPQFPDLTPAEWLGFARAIFRDEGGRPALSYDPRLREPVLAAIGAGPADLWPLFDALEGVPLLAIRGGLSTLFSAATLAEMAARRPDMAQVTLPNRGHVPFLTEPAALSAIDAFLEEHAR